MRGSLIMNTVMQPANDFNLLSYIYEHWRNIARFGFDTKFYGFM